MADPQGAPGALSHFDLARKDCFGTARNTTSKVWFTVAGGVLSDVYYPTIDNTNVETLRYVVTDGSTFTDVQGRDMTYTVAPIAGTGGMGCRIVTTANSGKYSITTDYVTDPAQNALLMKVAFKVNAPDLLRLYLRFDPTVNGNGGGGGGNGGADSASPTRRPGIRSSSPPIRTRRRTRPTATTRSPCTRRSTRRSRRTSPTASPAPPPTGSSSSTPRTRSPPPTASATNGNVVQTARVAGKGSGNKGDRRIDFTVALGFGSTQATAVQTAESALGDGFEQARDATKTGWKAYDDTLNNPPKNLPGIQGKDADAVAQEYFTSANVLKAVEDKTFPGALIAAPASPWGQAISAGDPANTYFGSYREVFARDLYEIWTGLMADGDTATARDATLFLFDRQQQPDGSMPRNSLVNGKTAPDSFNTQLDETAYPMLMADELHMTDPTLYADHVKPAANFVAAHGPSFGVERWEEQGGYSPSTIAAEIAGLVAAADLADANHDTASAAIWRGVADDYQRSIKGWTVTTTGPLSAAPLLHPPVEDRRPERGDLVQRRQRRAHARPALGDRRGLPRAVPARRAGARTIPTSSRRCRSSTRRSSDTTSSGQGLHRYNGDGYGDRTSDGRPWAPERPGHGPPLAGALGRAGRAAARRPATPPERRRCLLGMSKFASGVGLIPEQDWEGPDLAPVAVRHRSDRCVDRLRERRARRLGRAARLVGRLVRPARRRSRARASCSTGRRARTRATSRTPRARRISPSRPRPIRARSAHRP